MNLLSNSDESGATFSDIVNTGEKRGYTKNSIVRELKFLKKSNMTIEGWVTEKVGSAIFNSYNIKLKPEYRTAMMVVAR